MRKILDVLQEIVFNKVRWKLLSEFNYEIFLGKDNKYGVKQSDGSWDGLVGHLLRSEADIAMASLTINQVKNFY